MIKQINISDIPGRATRYNERIIQDIQQFLDSEWDAAEVSTQKYKSYKSAYSAYRATISKDFPTVDVITRDNRVFLIRKVSASA